MCATLLLPALLTLAGCVSSGSVTTYHLRVTGGQIATELVESWLAEAHAPGFAIERADNPSWSEIGFKALADGRCDLACTDRPIARTELERFAGRPVHGYRVAFYGYALYVHPSNPLDSIFSKHIALLFQRKVLDWKELAGTQIPNLEGPIALYGPRKSTRGGMVLMRQANIWFDKPTWEALDSDADIIAHVAADPLAMGFASVGYDSEGVRHLGIRMQRTGEPAFPSLEEIEADRYGLAKVIYVYHAGDPSPVIDAALDFLYSERGRQAIEGTEVWPIARERAAVAPPP